VTTEDLPISVPTHYAAGYARARARDAALADHYAAALTRGDPEADAVIDACARENGGKPEWIHQGIEHGPEALSDAPSLVREFFAAVAVVPGWWQPERAFAGCRLFQANVELLMTAFVLGSGVEGFSTRTSLPFSITGRIVDGGVLRLQQNNRHLLEIMLPGGMEREGEGWKLSLRARMMHARVRWLIRRSRDWDAGWEAPISAAQVAYAAVNFSGRMLTHARRIGLAPSDEESDSFMLIWRYAGHLMGVPEALQARDEASANHLHTLGRLFEPPVGLEAIQISNAVIASAPFVAGITEPQARRRLSRHLYRVSRALIGDPLADALNFPAQSTGWVVPMLRARHAADRLGRRIVPGQEGRRRFAQFSLMADISARMDGGLSYKLPSRLYAELDQG